MKSTGAARALLWAMVVLGAVPTAVAAVDSGAATDEAFRAQALPVLQAYCVECHSTEKHKGDLDLERFRSPADVLKEPRVWESVVEQVTIGEMPPKEHPQPSSTERQALLDWVAGALRSAALARAGDPGPVVLRRLNNAEYTFTVRDLTGVETLEPAAEFPADSASGEGFMNVGNSLVMSPALVGKYLDAAKAVAEHAVLLPDGIGFSPSTSASDWAQERLDAIRAFYARYTTNGGGSSVNLQGIKFDTRDGGVLPLAAYLQATLEHRGAVERGERAIDEVARAAGLNARYLAALWEMLHDRNPSQLLAAVQARWRAAGVEDAEALAGFLREWQAALFRFTQVGHIGKRDGPRAWQVENSPLTASREVRVALPPAGSRADRGDLRLELEVGDAGDGSAGDVVVWTQPRLVAPGRPDLLLRHAGAALAVLRASREQALTTADRCLEAAIAVEGPLDAADSAALARRHGVDPLAFSAWLTTLGLGLGEARLEGHLTQRMESAQGHEFIQGWVGADALSVVANASDQEVRIPGVMKPRSVAVHPAPNRRVGIGWRSPVEDQMTVEGALTHAHPECGNGVSWWVELRRGGVRQRLAAGVAHGTREVRFGPVSNLRIRVGDVVALVVGPRDGNHACDLTRVDLRLSGRTNTWDLAGDVSGSILAGNPHADRMGNDAVWHFYSEPDQGGADPQVLPEGSLLARWQTTEEPAERRALAAQLQQLLATGATHVAPESPDAALHRQLTAVDGPLMAALWRDPRVLAGEGHTGPTSYGLDPARFGVAPGGGGVAADDLGIAGPAVTTLHLPADLIAGGEFVATAVLHPELGREGSVQVEARLSSGPASAVPAASTELRPGAPLLVQDSSQARRRLEAALQDFRQLFPAALCYTQIVPVDEVVTLTLYYREDEPLRRLMLDAAEAARLERLWDELHYVSHDALKLVDAFEQLWQYATQDADPAAFTPMREPIHRRAQAFRELLRTTEPRHVDAVVDWASAAYRRPLTAKEAEDLRTLYARFRAEEIGHEAAVRLLLARVLVAPAFLYRAEQPVSGAGQGPVSDWELATRLSYFLWSSAPDTALRSVAASGRLREPEVLVAEARRMLRDGRTRRLAQEFGCAWLHVHGFDELGEKSERAFPTFGGLRSVMYEETIRFFTDLFQEDRSVLDILGADYAFVNPALAEHYGLAGIDFRDTNDWRRVEGVRAAGRGGILGQATVLAKQSGASRTSPILRGNWLSEVLLGEKLPRPPKNVPALPEDEATETLTVRELTERHASDPRCAGCHQRIDPYGFALEAYDAIGRRRERDLGGRPIDTRARVLDGTSLEGMEGLREYLLGKRRDSFVRQFCRKLLGYALGRGVLLSDQPLLDEMQRDLERNGYRVSAVVESIVRSRQFREIRGSEWAAHE